MAVTEPTDATLIDAEGEEVQPERSTAALVPVNVVHSPIVRPVASYDEAMVAFAEYERLRHTVVTRSDVTNIQGREFVNKSGWRKLAVIMGVSGQIVIRDYQRDYQARITSAEVIVRAVAPNGRSMDGLGVCDSHERCCPKAFDENAVCKDGRRSHTHCKEGCDGFNHFSKPQHDIPATAMTRALNRACSDLFGFGEVSAEEINDNEDPADPADCEAILAALNGIADEAQRRGAKLAFVSRFGKPDELLKGQVDAARRFCAASGAPVSDPAAAASNPDIAGAESTVASVDTTGGPARETSAGSESSGSDRGAGQAPDVSVTPEPPARPPANAPGDSSQEPGSAEPSPADDHARSEAGAAPTFKASTAAQRQRIGIRVAELVKKDLLAADRDKPEIVAILTGERTSTTTEASQDECNQMISTLTFIENGDLGMEDDEGGGRMLVARTQRGNDFLRPLLDGIAARAPRTEFDGENEEI